MWYGKGTLPKLDRRNLEEKTKMKITVQKSVKLTTEDILKLLVGIIPKDAENVDVQIIGDSHDRFSGTVFPGNVTITWTHSHELPEEKAGPRPQPYLDREPKD
jgi:hypothetical protein